MNRVHARCLDIKHTYFWRQFCTDFPRLDSHALSWLTGCILTSTAVQMLSGADELELTIV